MADAQGADVERYLDQDIKALKSYDKVAEQVMAFEDETKFVGVTDPYARMVIVYVSPYMHLSPVQHHRARC
jgi:hypothetical protein